jgi:hypothetical protein
VIKARATPFIKELRLNAELEIVFVATPKPMHTKAASMPNANLNQYSFSMGLMAPSLSNLYFGSGFKVAYYLIEHRFDS